MKDWIANLCANAYKYLKITKQFFIQDSLKKMTIFLLPFTDTVFC